MRTFNVPLQNQGPLGLSLLLTQNYGFMNSNGEGYEGIPYIAQTGSASRGCSGDSRSGFVPSEISVHIHTMIIHARS